MSDDEYEFDYEDEDDPMEEDDEEVEISNKYYDAKSVFESDPQKAKMMLKDVIKMEPEKGEWGFKALKRIVKICFHIGEYQELLQQYKELISYTKTAVTKNESEKVINNILDYVSSSQKTDTIIQELYQITLNSLEETKNERLWFRTNLKLGNYYFEKGEYAKVARIVKELMKTCSKEDGTPDVKKGTQLVEIYALEIQLHTATKNTKRLQKIYEQSLVLKNAIAHPKTMGVIRECGGKMHMLEHQWEQAQVAFFESFKNYDEAGSPRRIQVLKYVLLANMLMSSPIDPFDAVEAKPYKHDPALSAMTNLIAAYHDDDIRSFENILRIHRQSILDDPFIKLYIDDLLKNIRTKVLLKLVQPYSTICIPYISKELSIPSEDVETLLVSLILDGFIPGSIDQVKQLLVMHSKSQELKKYTSTERWCTQLVQLNHTIFRKIS